MKTKPILFQGDMVRAILEGRKTQTRRIVKPQPLGYTGRNFIVPDHAPKAWHDSDDFLSFCPYGQPGDLLWCRETWGEGGGNAPDLVLYRADYPSSVPSGYENIPPASEIRWKPSIHMPRWASRLTLEVTDVRVERVQDISEEDALAEGIQWSDWLDGYHAGQGRHFHCFHPSRSFESLWDSINEPRGYGWDANPWVWVVEFRPIEANVDQVLAERGAE